MKTSKAKKYAVQQHLIQNEVIYLLGLDQDGFYLCEIDNNTDIQEQIMSLVPEIRKYFCHVNITGLLYPQRCKRPWLSIVRGILKNRYRLKYQACRYHPSDSSSSEDSEEVNNTFTMRYYLEPTQKTTKKTISKTKTQTINNKGKITLNLTFRTRTPKKTLQLKKNNFKSQTESKKTQNYQVEVKYQTDRGRELPTSCRTQGHAIYSKKTPYSITAIDC